LCACPVVPVNRENSKKILKGSLEDYGGPGLNWSNLRKNTLQLNKNVVVIVIVIVVVVVVVVVVVAAAADADAICVLTDRIPPNFPAQAPWQQSEPPLSVFMDIRSFCTSDSH